MKLIRGAFTTIGVVVTVWLVGVWAITRLGRARERARADVTLDELAVRR